jgi:uncharacterized sulfatase
LSSTFSRRSLLAGVAGALASCGRHGRPNILLALADDQSWLHTQAGGSPNVRTPAFDRIAHEGISFAHSFCASPSCTPSRTAILTGRQMWQIEEGGVLYGTLPPRYPLFSHLLVDAGYHVGFTGKGWGPGEWDAGGLKRPPIGKEYNRRKLAQAISTGISEGDYAANFDDFLQDRPQGAPFFFWFGCREPHRPYQNEFAVKSGKKLEKVTVPPFWPDSEQVRSDILDYCSEIDWFDHELGLMLARLEALGELDHTLVVVTSDNGMPFPRAKANLYDWGVRMPLAMRWRGQLSGGRVREDFVSHIDLAPTFLEAAGIHPPEEMTGRSLLSTTDRDAVFTGMERHTWCRPDGATYPMRAARTRDYLYIRNFAPDRWPTGGPDFVSSNKTFHGDVDEGPTKTFMLTPDNAVKFRREFDLCFGKRPGEELYDLNRDGFQMNNVAADPAYADTVARLRTRLERMLRETGDPRIAGQDPWQSYVYRQTIGFGATYNRSLPEDVREQARTRPTHKPE